jgi:hypothetical protein
MRGDVAEPVNVGGAQRGGSVQPAHNRLGDDRAPLFGQKIEQSLFSRYQGVDVVGLAVEETGNLDLNINCWGRDLKCPNLLLVNVWLSTT